MPSASRLELEKLCSDHYHDLTAQMVLEMGHENSINRDIRKGRTDAKTKKLVLKLEKMFRCVD